MTTAQNNSKCLETCVLKFVKLSIYEIVCFVTKIPSSIKFVDKLEFD